MSTATTTLKSLLSALALRRQPATPAAKRTTTQLMAAINAEAESEYAQFLSSIAHLAPEEQAKRIERRTWYARLAERQAIADIEAQMERYC